MCEVFQKQRTFGNSRYPFTLARPGALITTNRFLGAFAALEEILVFSGMNATQANTWSTLARPFTRVWRKHEEWVDDG